MTQPTIVLRAVKGSPLTWTEGDANFTNLKNAAVPTGGTTGQVLTKNSNTDYDIEFKTIIDDSSTTGTGVTWSADKLNTVLGDISAALTAINGE